MINREKKSEYSIARLQYTKKFSSIEDLRVELKSMNMATRDIGYIVPGHGAKGRQMWLGTQEDLDEMYKIIDKKVKREMLLWCYKTEVEDSPPVRSRKRPLSPSNNNMVGKRSNPSSQKLEEVEKILKGLKEKHGSNYSIEKLNAWAHLLHIGKHTSHEEPPNLPYFKGGKNKQTPIELERSPPVQLSSSPSKRLGLRGDCIEQLSKWHALLEKGAISIQQYDELKTSIMGDLFKLGPVT